MNNRRDKKIMTLKNLEQRLAVNPFANKVEIDKRPEEIQKVELDVDDESKKMVKKIIEQYAGIKEGITGAWTMEKISSLKMEVLTPKQIQLVLLFILNGDDHKSIFNPETGFSVAGRYLSKLIQKSYNAGNNNFIINILDFQVNIDRIAGEKKDPLNITIIGNGCNKFGNSARYCNFDIQGNVENICGAGSNYCTYTIQGDVGYCCGLLSEYCTYDINGNSGSSCGCGSKKSTYNINGNSDVACGNDAKECTFTIKGNAEKNCAMHSENSTYNIIGDVARDLGYNSKNCTYTIGGNIIKPCKQRVKQSTFKVKSKEAYDLLVKSLPKHNIIQLIDDNGKITEEMKKKYDGNK